MEYQIKNSKRLLQGQRVKCIDNSSQYGLEVDKIYTVRKDEKKASKGTNRKVTFEEIRGSWQRQRFILL